MDGIYLKPRVNGKAQGFCAYVICGVTEEDSDRDIATPE